MCALAALGTMPGESTGKSLLALSGPVLRPHNPLLRHSLLPVEPNSGDSAKVPSSLPGRFRSIGYTSDPSTFEENNRMAEATIANELANEASDDELLTRYQQLDDHTALAELERRYHRVLLARASRNLDRALQADAEDMVQEALLTFHRNRKKYAPGGVRALLNKIVVDCCIEHLRSTGGAKRDRSRTVHLQHSEWATDEDRHGESRLPPEPKADPKKQDTKMDVDEALAALTPEQAQAVRLDMQGHTQASAAEAANIPLGTYKDHLHFGRQRLKQILAPTVILLPLVGAVADNCDLDVCMNLVSAEADEDEVCQEGSNHHDSKKLCRKSRMRLPIWPETQNMTTVVNARNEEYDVLIARPSKWGNPFQIGRDGSRERVIQMYEVHVRRRPDLLAALPELAGKGLGCYCKPEACHGDVLVKLLRELFLEV